MSPRLLAALSPLLLTGCGTLAAQPEQPAVVALHTEQSRAELRRVVSTAMNGEPVTLGDDVLLHDSVLTVERRAPAGEQGRAATGRTLEAPVRFNLLLRGTSCLLRAADGREWPLDDVQCRPAGAAP